MVNLYIVATPIGNLEDITARAKRILQTVPTVFAEDTRHTKILLEALGAHPRLISYHHHTSPERLWSLLDLLENEDAALVTDAGTPGVNDPGGVFVAKALERFGNDIAIVPIPGPSALLAAAQVSGFPMDSFLFLGFPPHKKGRQTFFNTVAETSSAVIFYESPHRILSALEELAKRQPERKAVVCRELTKKFETISRGTFAELSSRLQAEKTRGEYVVAVGPSDF